MLFDEQDRWFLWVPVALVLGISTYFGLPREPLFLVLAGFSGLLLIIAYRARNWLPGGFIVLLAALFVTGMFLAKLRSEWVAAPVLQEPVSGAVIDGYVELVAPRSRGGFRVTVRVLNIEQLSPDETPYRVRINLRNDDQANALQLGSAVTIRAWLGPPPGPASPGDFDFARSAFFQRIGAVGTAFSISPATSFAAEPGWLLAVTARINETRMAIAARIRESLPGDNGAIAAALITGLRGGIAQEDVENLRTAGLAHILAISGLHMSLAAGSVFMFLRSLLALFPPLVLHYPVKKIAALVAIVCGAGYLVISGASIATQRAFIMITIMFVAVLLDRPAITMRNVALAALLIILMRPESVMTPSFRMSFAAVTALVAAYEFRETVAFTRFREAALWQRLAMRPFVYLAGVSLTTVVAAAATAPFAAYHFHHMAPFALAGNLLGIPVIAFIIMPAALISMVAMGFGLEAYPLFVMGTGIDWMLRAAAMVAAWPGSARVIAAMPDVALLAMVLGALWLCFWQKVWRLGGVAVIGAGIALMWAQDRPDILIDARANSIALRESSGQLQVLVRGRSTYAAERWLERDGDMRGIDQVGAENFVCDKLACVAALPDGSHMALILKRAAMGEECRAATIVIFKFRRRAPCVGPELVIDQSDLSDDGAVAVWLENGAVIPRHAAPRAANRPWRRQHGDKQRDTSGQPPKASDKASDEPGASDAPGKPI